MFTNKVTDCAADMLRDMFNPFGIPGHFLPRYDEFVRGKKDVELTAYHEAAHVLAYHLLDTNSSVLKVSCKQAFGSTGRCTIERNFETPRHIKAHIVRLMAGSATEKILMGKHHKPRGTQNDIDEAKFFINDAFGQLPKKETERILQQAEDEAYKLLLENKDKLELLVSA